MRQIIAVTLGALALACSSPRGEPAVGSQSKVVEWTATADSLRVALDGSRSATVTLKATMSDGWHIYATTQTQGGPVPLRVEVSPPYEIAGEIEAPTPVKEHDPNFGIDTETYSGQPTFRIPVRLAPASAGDSPPVELQIRSQACTDRVCLPAKTTTVTATPGTGVL